MLCSQSPAHFGGVGAAGMSRQVLMEACPGEWKQHLVHERNRRRRAFDVEQDRAEAEPGETNHMPGGGAVGK
jgi:hypothetical protein